MKSSKLGSKKNSNEQKKPVLTPEKLVTSWTLRSPSELSLKKRAIVTIDNTSLEFLREKTGAVLNRMWHPLRKIYEIPEKNTILTRSFPSGPCVVSLIEELFCFGSSEIVFFGFCGSIVEGISIGDTVVVKGAFCDEGTSRHYLPKKKVVLSNWFEECWKTAEGCGIFPVLAWTTDGLYRETEKKINYFRSMGAHVVDMEVASLYAACNSLKIKVISFLVVSDTLLEGSWTPGFHSKDFKNGKENALCFIANNFVL